MTDLTREQIAELLGGIEDPLHWHNSGRAKQEMNNAAPDLARQLLATPTAIAASPEMQALLAAETARADAAEALVKGLRDFVVDFADAKIDALRYSPPYGASPEDEPDPVVDAETVWAWQADAKDAIKAAALAQQPPASGDDGRE